ncbi:hypothetical protein CMK14_19145 [Candidatus Poribacteria bacterium]|nr:hypothetical protein [Candidatus Poribacteria bacterium]MAT77246.1 hypothetical protein [Candidatus Poribacteria bacterium]
MVKKNKGQPPFHESFYFRITAVQNSTDAYTGLVWFRFIPTRTLLAKEPSSQMRSAKNERTISIRGQ